MIITSIQASYIFGAVILLLVVGICVAAYIAITRAIKGKSLELETINDKRDENLRELIKQQGELNAIGLQLAQIGDYVANPELLVNASAEVRALALAGHVNGARETATALSTCQHELKRTRFALVHEYKSSMIRLYRDEITRLEELEGDLMTQLGMHQTAIEALGMAVD